MRSAQFSYKSRSICFRSGGLRPGRLHRLFGAGREVAMTNASLAIVRRCVCVLGLLSAVPWVLSSGDTRWDPGGGAAPAQYIVDGVVSASPGGESQPSSGILVVLPPPDGATVIHFDDFQAPCYFLLTTALTDRYSALGVQFSGPGEKSGGAILDQC